MHKTRCKAWTCHIGLAVAATVLAACSSTSVKRAPVEDRGINRAAPAAVNPAAPPGAENAGRPGHYTVRQGDTIMKIAAEVNQPWREIARWNNLDNPNVIEVGQVLRVVPPPSGAPPAPVAAPAAPARGATPPAPVPVATQTTPGVASAASAPASAPAPVAPPPPTAKTGDVNFIWPAGGAVIAGFDEDSTKGINIAGNAGDAVLAAADGSVVYVGVGPSGYGNLVILKHNNTFLTAYANNRTLLVKEDQVVKKGQKIAEMGATGTDRVQLHFEIRRSGKAVDPVRYLPSR